MWQEPLDDTRDGEPSLPMNAPDPRPPSPPPEPFLQRLYDSPFVLLAIGLGVMLVLFTFWGIWEVMSLPQATLP